MIGLIEFIYREAGMLGIAYARVAPVFYLLPFMNDRTLANAILKNTVIFLVIGGMWPALGHPLMADGASLLGLAVQEATAGLILGVSLSLPFWVATAAGEFIDNQRGATISDSIDPATGVETSVLAPFISLFYATVFLQQGGMLTLVQAIRDSYTVVPTGTLLHADVWRFGALLTDLVGKGVTMAAPVLITMFLSDVMLGLLARVCPQLNAFSLSLSVKSIVAFFVFHLYFVLAGPPALTAIFSLHPFSQLVN